MHQRTRIPVPFLKQSGQTIPTSFFSRSSLLKSRNQLAQENQTSVPQQSHVTAPAVGHSFGQVSVQPPVRSTLQAKLTIGQPNDKYEQEADRVAQQVMLMPEPTVQMKEIVQPSQSPTIQTLCSECEEKLQRQPLEELEEDEDKVVQTKSLAGQITPLVQRQNVFAEEEEEEETLQTKSESGEQLAVSPNLQKRLISLQGKGQPLAQSERTFFESRFGADFSQVRVHNRPHEAETARDLNAKAFTIGHNVVFREGQYQPKTFEGRRLLAHELTHVVQQNAVLKKPASGTKLRTNVGFLSQNVV